MNKTQERYIKYGVVLAFVVILIGFGTHLFSIAPGCPTPPGGINLNGASIVACSSIFNTSSSSLNPVAESYVIQQTINAGFPIGPLSGNANMTVATMPSGVVLSNQQNAQFVASADANFTGYTNAANKNSGDSQVAFTARATIQQSLASTINSTISYNIGLLPVTSTSTTTPTTSLSTTSSVTTTIPPIENGTTSSLTTTTVTTSTTQPTTTSINCQQTPQLCVAGTSTSTSIGTTSSSSITATTTITQTNTGYWSGYSIPIIGPLIQWLIDIFK